MSDTKCYPYSITFKHDVDNELILEHIHGKCVGFDNVKNLVNIVIKRIVNKYEGDAVCSDMVPTFTDFGKELTGNYFNGNIFTIMYFDQELDSWYEYTPSDDDCDIALLDATR